MLPPYLGWYHISSPEMELSLEYQPDADGRVIEMASADVGAAAAALDAAPRGRRLV